ncbi:MAG: type II secretion system protein [Thermoguttaceae bacterium]
MPNQNAWTLVELLIVIAIIGAICVLLIPAAPLPYE